ncbi:hypothetical protein [Rhizobium ruizarguesonis]|uniref:hypothetical protein n=1 Tax=Rhizobium ruizarguesonis TaxID=2081791 RepID=UPI00143F9E5D|nr:hypothetical protein [Rhizobium ruizarguesonis]
MDTQSTHSLFLQKMPLAADSAMPFSLARQQIILAENILLLCKITLQCNILSLLPLHSTRCWNLVSAKINGIDPPFACLDNKCCAGGFFGLHKGPAK